VTLPVTDVAPVIEVAPVIVVAPFTVKPPGATILIPPPGVISI
jgi:hypothetical protein